MVYVKNSIMREFYKKFICLIVFVFSLCSLGAIGISVKASPTVFSPFLTGGNDKYEPVAFGGVIDPGISLWDTLLISPELGFYVLPKLGKEELKTDQDQNVILVPIGAHVGAQLFPLSRLELGVGIAGGSCIEYHNGFHYAPWYRAYGDILFRINPNLSVGVTGSWFDAQYSSWFGNPLAQGLSAGLTVKFNYDTKKSAGNVEATIDQDESIYPLLYTIYKENPFGSIFVKNEETAEIRNVKVSFRAGDYTNSQLECGEVKYLKKHGEVEIPLVADFSENILNFTENGKIPGEIVIEYELLGKKKYAVSQVIVPVYNRNQVRWTDSAVLASYISSSSQEVLELSKYLVGVARTYLRSGLNRNMQFSMYVFEGLRLAGIKCESDSSTPYDLLHIDSSLIDYIQYPYQTMLYKSGDKDDIGVLLMALLQSVGISTAFIPTSNDFIVCFNTGVSEAKIDTLFDGSDRVIVLDEEVWIPLSMSSLNEGFINSWYKAIVEIQESIENEQDLEVVDIAQAWTVYPPAGFSSGEHIDIMPAEGNLSAAVETDIARYITAEFGPQIAAIQNRIKTEGASVELYNKLGMLFVRAGMYSSAIPVYQASAKMGSVSAMNNLGNIASIQKKYTDAQYWYMKALEYDPENSTALKNLNRIQTELEK